MKVKSILAAAVLAASSAASFAVTPLTVLVPDTVFMGGGPAGSYSFTLASGPTYSLSASVAVILNSVTGVQFDTDSTFGGGTSFVQSGNAWSLLPQSPLAGGSYFINIQGSSGSSSIASVLATSTPLAVVPEPETYAMMLAGLGAIGFVAVRRKSI